MLGKSASKAVGENLVGKLAGKKLPKLAGEKIAKLPKLAGDKLNKFAGKKPPLPMGAGGKELTDAELAKFFGGAKNPSWKPPIEAGNMRNIITDLTANKPAIKDIIGRRGYELTSELNRLNVPGKQGANPNALNEWIEKEVVRVDKIAKNNDEFSKLMNNNVKQKLSENKEMFNANHWKEKLPPKEKGYEWHHLATNKNKKFTPRFEKIAGKYGLKLDGKWNKMYVQHRGAHAEEYNAYVLERMQEIDKVAQGDQDIFLELFEDIEMEIFNNPEMLYKQYWKELEKNGKNK